VCDGIQRVRYGYDPCSRRYFVAFQTTWIAGPVESLMVRINNFADVFKERNFYDELVSPKWMLTNNRDLFIVQRSRLA